VRPHLILRTCCVWLLLAVPPLWAANPAPEVLKSIQASTFEVVLKKPDQDPVTYEKPLPLELLPYAERADAYRGVGTAFALGHNQYVTAAHVLIAAVDSQYGSPAVRRADGAVFQIDRILKFSAYQDFVVFSLQGDPAPPGLAVNQQPQLTDPVLAVGNALGEGIIVRDGLYTSATAEEQDGRWKWIRFSAAASPGNSGGPLTDMDGRVIGVVVRKSPNENLNYALPIAEVLNAPDGKARFDYRGLMRLAFLQGTQTQRIQDGFDLPLTWSAFARAYQAVIVRQDELGRAALLKIYADTLFTTGKGAEQVLYAADANGFRPRLITQQKDNSWSATSPSYNSTDLGGDGSVAVGVTGGAVLLRLVRPGHAADDAFYADSRAFMDLALKGLNLTRTVGSDRVRFISLGPAQSDSVYVDHFGRKWQERVWAVPVMDVYVHCLLLPTPDGYSGVVQYEPSAVRATLRQNAYLLLDQVDVSLNGTLPQWRAYLARRALLPAALGDVTLQQVAVRNATQWQLRTRRYAFGAPPGVLPLTDESVLSLTMGFMPLGTQVGWDIESAWWYRDEKRRQAVGLWRRLRPPPSAALGLRTTFDDMLSRHAPYDGRWRRVGDSSYQITTLIEVPGTKAGLVAADLMYGLTMRTDEPGNPPLSVLPLFQQLTAAVRIAEIGTGENMVPRQVPSAALAGSAEGTADNAALAPERADEQFGRDLRGRLYSEDRKDQQTSGARAEVIAKYWSRVPAVMHNRALWTDFLQRNRLPADTAHDPGVVAAEKALLDSLRDGPTEQSASLSLQLVQAYVQERRQIAGRVFLRPGDAEFRARLSPCPAPADRTSGVDHPVMRPMRRTPAEFYPDATRRMALEGLVIVAMRVSDTGCLASLAIAASSGSPDLDDAALRFAETLEFLPAEKAGQAVAYRGRLPVMFRLQDDAPPAE